MHANSPPAIGRCYHPFVADVRPFRALRYAPNLDLANAISPPFDIISPDQQRALHERSPYNAVHIELAEDSNGSRYERASAALRGWLDQDILRREGRPAFYLHDHQFERDGVPYSRRLLFARLHLEPWDKGIVLPHEQTFGAPIEDRLRLLRAIQTNTSPVFLIYRDHDRQVETLLASAAIAPPGTEFRTDDGQSHGLRRIDDPRTIEALSAAFELEVLYIADGHHRYETALVYRDERRAAAASDWTGKEPDNFALVALAAADDPGLLVLPIHRVTASGIPLDEALQRLSSAFTVEKHPSLDDLSDAAASRREQSTFGLLSGESEEFLLLTVADRAAINRLLPQDRSPAWRSLDYAIANNVILQQVLGLSDTQMSDYGVLWFTEDAAEAAHDVRAGRARYAVLMNPVPVQRVLDVADSGERMPQKSTFFYPKVPTGLVFNPLEE
jgi:uncharacterized protein (DUF1015 family)